MEEKKCPKCKEGNIVVKSGKYGMFAACDRYPECKFTAKPLDNLPSFINAPSLKGEAKGLTAPTPSNSNQIVRMCALKAAVRAYGIEWETTGKILELAREFEEWVLR